MVLWLRYEGIKPLTGSVQVPICILPDPWLDDPCLPSLHMGQGLFYIPYDACINQG